MQFSGYCQAGVLGWRLKVCIHPMGSLKCFSCDPVPVTRDGWTFLTNHGHVLVCLAKDEDVLLRDVALRTGITERAVHQIICDLEQAGIIMRTRMGRRNRYILRRSERFRHPLEADVSVGDFVDLLEAGHKRRVTVEGRRVPPDHDQLTAADPRR